MTIEFEWQKSNAYVLSDDGAHIRQVGKRPRWIKPLARGKPLYEIFSTIDEPGRALDFVSEYGFLNKTPAALSAIPESERVESVEDLLNWAAWCRYCIWLKRDPHCIPDDIDEHAEFGFMDPIRLDVPIASRSITNFKLKLVPVTLLDAIRFQLAQALSGPARAEVCRYCGEPFLTGTPSGPKHGTSFCRPDHRTKFNNNIRAGRYEQFGRQWGNEFWSVTSFGIECARGADGESHPYFISYTQLSDLFPGEEVNGIALWPVHIAAQAWAEFPSFCKAFEFAIEREHVPTAARILIDLAGTLRFAKSVYEKRKSPAVRPGI